MADIFQTLNPFMPTRHLRRSAMIVRKGGGGSSSTTNVTNTGLGDEQYQGIMDNLAENFGNADVRYEELKPMLDNMGVDTDQLLTDLSTLSSAQSTGFTNLTDLMNTQAADTISRDSVMRQGQLDQQASLGNLASDMGTGFTDVRGDITTLGGNVDTRFDAVDQANTNLQNTVNTGFQDQRTGFSDLEGRMIQDRAAQDTSFGEVGNQLTNLGTGQDSMMANQGDLADGQTGLAGRINDLSGDVEGVGANLDTYYGDLAANQADMLGNQGEFKSTFDTYVERYADDTTLANQKRGDIQQQLENGFAAVRSGMGDNTTAINRNLDRVAQTAERGFTDQVQAMNAGFAAQFDDIAELSQQVAGMDRSMVNNFGMMAEAFDDTGNLIQSSINADGTITNRRISSDGMLIAERMNSMGQVVDTESLNVSDTLGKMQEFQSSGLMSQ